MAVNIYEYLDYRTFLLDHYEEKKRTTRGMTVALSKGGFDPVRKMIRAFRLELGARCAEEKNPGAVYQVNFQLFSPSEVSHE